MSSPPEKGVTNRKAKNPLLPETFEQRGVYVPFTTPILAYARLRRPIGGSLEVLIPGLAGGSETYIIPYKVLPDVLNLLVHDRALHEELLNLRKISPGRVRQSANLVAMTGLGGPALAKRAKQDRQSEQELPTLILFSLIRNAISQLAPSHPGVANLDGRQIATPEGLNLAREALGGYGQTIGESGNKIYARLERWANVLAPLGMSDGSIKGPLLILLTTLEDLTVELSKWLIQEPPDTAEMAQRTVTAARAAAQRARDHLNAIAEMEKAMAEPLRSFDETENKITLHIERISLMLDGWQRVIDLWEMGRDGDRFFQRDTLEGFAQYLPILPLEAVGENVELWENLRESQNRWGRTSEHGIDAGMDQETKAKLSKFRKEPV
tara:strand:+ start:3661 stop:4803 length:1143 start_codon:yes stop_codon:yes gene_type:complete